ncbi:MAG: hypothetical protein UX89_C0022G0018 [Parcubacteria group bacterium GW2011_GWA2_47_16]|nr:MAG: hypothetical protein UX89_C0022G0018 [Parcubacteria group bacterium GW2011_GWA2_47_16]
MVVEFKFESQSVFIDVADWRGNVYKYSLKKYI